MKGFRRRAPPKARVPCCPFPVLAMIAAHTDLDTLLQARQVPEVAVEVDSGTHCSEQILVSDPFSIVTSGGKVPAEQNRRDGRVHSARPSVPELV